MRYYKQVSDESLVVIGIGPGGTEITESEYNTLPTEIREKAVLVGRMYSDDVPVGWQEEI